MIHQFGSLGYDPGRPGRRVVLYERKQPTSEERAKSAKRLVDVNAEDVISVLLERPGLPKSESTKLFGSTGRSYNDSVLSVGSHVRAPTIV